MYSKSITSGLPFSSSILDDVENCVREAELNWAQRLQPDIALTRPLVSFQANKSRTVYRWFKYKEAFSADLIEFFLERHQITDGTVFDPFAGSGTSLFAAGGLGLKSEGIELLPIGQFIIKTRQIIEDGLTDGDIKRLSFWREQHPWNKTITGKPIIELRITRGAYPDETFKAIGRYLLESDKEEERVRTVLLFALLCVLESISYTRKDGQYLRWDYRSGRRQGKKTFDKGKILGFDEAITGKLHDIISDLRFVDFPDDLFATKKFKANVHLHHGSCLTIMPKIPDAAYDCLITSPPYCNRYDYTRTYALELALLGVDENGIKSLRQEMLSCTVENRAKNLLDLNPKWKQALFVADQQQLLQSILGYLDSQKLAGVLNNTGIPRMVRGYFYEMACVIYEAARVLKSGSPLIMVNDNVRYAGASIPVDIILSQMAEELGFTTETILVLPNGKGNSSQQMGLHGRETLRKCVYLWRKE